MQYFIRLSGWDIQLEDYRGFICNLGYVHLLLLFATNWSFSSPNGCHFEGESTITLTVVIRASHKSSINHFIFKDIFFWTTAGNNIGLIILQNRLIVSLMTSWGAVMIVLTDGSIGSLYYSCSIQFNKSFLPKFPTKKERSQNTIRIDAETLRF